MKFYWYDHTEVDDKPCLSGLSRLVVLFNAEKIGSPDEFAGNQSVQRKLGFIHTGNVPGERRDDWNKVAKDGAWIVFVSTQPLDTNQVISHVHYSKMPCNSLADHLSQDIANALIETCKQNKPNFDLFYPLKTENLVALYLLELANQDTDEIKDFKLQIRNEAEKEYHKIKGDQANLPQERSQLLNILRIILTPLATK